MLKGKSARGAVTASSGLLLIAALIGMVLAVGSASASVPQPKGAIPAASGKMTKVIVLLRDRAAGLSAQSTARAGRVHAEVAPLAHALRAHGARHVTSGTTLPFVVASVSSAQEKALKANSAVQAVFSDAVISLPKPDAPAAPQLVSSPVPFTPKATDSAAPSPGPCGTPSKPEQDPQALGLINAKGAWKLGFDGAGVKTAYLAGGIDPTIPDFQRNAKYASAGSPAGSPVVTAVSFAGDPAADQGGDAAGESFLDASSIAAQGNTKIDLSNFVSTAHPLPTGCDITLTGAAPGASVLGLDIFSNDHDTTFVSNVIQGVQYAIAHGVKVINESFGANNFPDTAQDAVRMVDDQAVAAGATVVVSSGDAGITNTIGSPASDPKLISVGATTSFRALRQFTFGGFNATSPNSSSGKWLDDNISSFSSAGFTQSGGNTVDLVAPGDWNWALCSMNTAVFSSCTNENGGASPIQFTGGTSESAPLTAGAAADVIQAYAKTHHGKSPSPALIKQILISSATDINAPAEQQGAGILNIGAAVKLAESIKAKHHRGGVLLSPNQINITQNPGQTATKRIRVTNESNKKMTFHLSTRMLTKRVASHSGSFCLNPTSQQIPCGGPTTHTFQIWSGVTEAYQEETFTVPHTGHKKARLNFMANYPATGQSSLLHVALYDPSGAYAEYSDAQGLGNYADMQVANPKPGTWTAVFFTVEGDPGQDGIIPGTNGTIDWRAETWTYGTAGKIKPASLTLKPGQTKSAKLKVKSPKTSGDTAQSVVVKSKSGTTTIPVTVRTLVKVGSAGGSFKGVLTGGNGRSFFNAVTSTYAFKVPSGKKDIDVSVHFSNVEDDVVGFLQDPQGNTVASSSNITFDSSGQNVDFTGHVNLYADNPQAGRWSLVLDWLGPVATHSYSDLSMPFSGQIQFNQVNASSTLPSGATLTQGHTYTYNVTVKNTGASPQLFFLDPRASGTATIQLPDLVGSDQNMKLPLDPGLTFPVYVVPPDTTQLQASLSGNAPVTFDIEPYPGDPDVSPALSGTQSGNSASLTYTPGGEVATGFWALQPDEIGPYPDTGAPAVTASANFSIVTQAFDPTVDPSTGDLWSVYAGLTAGSSFNPLYLNPGQSATLPLTITPSASSGTSVTGSIKVDDVFQLNAIEPFAELSGDELASLPYSYTVG